MAVDNLNFIGINRAISDYASAGACEELINLRPTTGGLVPVKPFAVKMSQVSWQKIYEHKAGSVTNYIAISRTSPAVIYRIDGSGQVIGSALGSFSVSTGFQWDSIHFAQAGNIILFSIADKATRTYANLSFVWNGTEYVQSEAAIPAITATIIPGEVKLFHSSVQATYSHFTPLSEITNAINSAFNEIQSTNEGYCFGPVILALAYKTRDNKTFWTDTWLVYDPRQHIDAADNISSDYVVEYETYHETAPWLFPIPGENAYLTRTAQTLQLAGIPLTLQLDGTGDWNEETSMITSIEIYASKPVVFANTDDPLLSPTDTSSTETFLPPLMYQSMNLEGQLMYLQKSIPLKELEEAEDHSLSIELEFGGNIQMTNKTLVVDAGAVTRYGDILAYNARFHYFDSVAVTEIEANDIGVHFRPRSASLPVRIFVVFNDGNEDVLKYVGTRNLPYDAYQPARLIIAPSLNVKEVVLWTHAVNPGVPTLDMIRRYAMTPSKTYNCSLNYTGSYELTGVVPQDLSDAYDAAEGEYATFLVEEPDAINVTEQYNPFVFNVRNSYLAPGKVLDVKPQMVAVLDVSYGDYPLNVFTNRGLYALLQGSGDVLYGNFRSISNLVTTSNSISTENGTFFIAAGGLWAVAGATAVLVSDALSLGPHKFVRRTQQYWQLYYATGYSVLPLISVVPFEDFVSGGSLAYNRYRDEIIVSNPERDYSYVLSLKYRQWFKIDRRIWQDTGGEGIAWAPSGSAKDLLDFSTEVDSSDTGGGPVLVHLESRPFSISYQYIHVHRIVSMIRGELGQDERLVVSLFGSDNLQDWTLLSYSDRQGTSGASLKFSQVRTPSAARSWRYYTVCIGGKVPTDTDFGTVMFDYQPVVRRIG